MYVWKSKSRRDRRHFASTGLETLDEADLDTLRKNEIGVRKEEEVNRYELEVSLDNYMYIGGFKGMKRRAGALVLVLFLVKTE